jgi:hypothetical protein
MRRPEEHTGLQDRHVAANKPSRGLPIAIKITHQQGHADEPVDRAASARVGPAEIALEHARWGPKAATQISLYICVCLCGLHPATSSYEVDTGMIFVMRLLLTSPRATTLAEAGRRRSRRGSGFTHLQRIFLPAL